MTSSDTNPKITNGKSFGALIDSGMSKEDIMRVCCMTEREFEKVLASLKRIREDIATGKLRQHRRGL
jgi:hypothetical protein